MNWKRFFSHSILRSNAIILHCLTFNFKFIIARKHFQQTPLRIRQAEKIRPKQALLPDSGASWLRRPIRWLLLGLWLGNCPVLSAQADIDAYAARLELRDGDLVRLTDTLTDPYPTETEKARAIFAWIAAHIAYDCGGENRLETAPEAAMHPLFYTQAQLRNILATRRTRCEGFAFLFKLMCNLSGIYCTVVEGYARFSGEKVDPATVLPNHAWNAVRLDGAWAETDVSAGAGHCAGRRFRRAFQPEYFRMSPDLLERTYIMVEDGRRSFNQGRILLKF